MKPLANSREGFRALTNLAVIEELSKLNQESRQPKGAVRFGIDSGEDALVCLVVIFYQVFQLFYSKSPLMTQTKSARDRTLVGHSQNRHGRET